MIDNHDYDVSMRWDVNAPVESPAEALARLTTAVTDLAAQLDFAPTQQGLDDLITGLGPLFSATAKTALALSNGPVGSGPYAESVESFLKGLGALQLAMTNAARKRMRAG